MKTLIIQQHEQTLFSTTLFCKSKIAKLPAAKRGFTLIELLVVVLIIGILAAIALPQYEKAVKKSRATEVLALGRVLRDSMNRTLLLDMSAFDNFDYVPLDYLQLLDVDFPYEIDASTGGAGQVFNNLFEIEIWPTDITFFLRYNEWGNRIQLTTNKHATPNIINCYSRFDHSVAFCTSLGGKNCAVNTYCKIE